MSEPTWRAESFDAALRDELDRLHPERVLLRPEDLTGVRHAMDGIDEMWGPTLAWARDLPPARLHERVDGEYSFVETQRHLLFAGDAWLRRGVLGSDEPFHEWGVPPDSPTDAPRDTGPDLDDVLVVRRARAMEVRAFLAGASQEDLARRVGGPWDPPDVPTEKRVRVIDCFWVVFREEWWHHHYAVRDLAVLSSP